MFICSYIKALFLVNLQYLNKIIVSWYQFQIILLALICNPCTNINVPISLTYLYSKQLREVVKAAVIVVSIKYSVILIANNITFISNNNILIINYNILILSIDNFY